MTYFCQEKKLSLRLWSTHKHSHRSLANLVSLNFYKCFWINLHLPLVKNIGILVTYIYNGIEETTVKVSLKIDFYLIKFVISQSLKKQMVYLADNSSYTQIVLVVKSWHPINEPYNYYIHQAFERI